MVPACVVNSIVTANYLQQMGLSIANSVGDCKSTPSVETQEVCASDIFGVLQCLFNSIGYISGLVSQCQAVPDGMAECVSNSHSLVGDVMELLQGLLSIINTCGKLKPGPDSSREVPEKKRRLRGSSSDGAENATNNELNSSNDDLDNITLGGMGFAFAANETFPVFSSDKTPGIVTGLPGAWCYLNIASAIGYLAQAGINIDASTSVCDYSNSTTSVDRHVCAADISAVIASVADVVSYIGGAASLCAKSINLPGLCTGDVGTIGNALAGIVSASTQFLSVCTNITANGKKVIHHSR